MTTKITATYRDGAFIPDVDPDLPEGVVAQFFIGDRFETSLPEDSPLAAAEREFAAAFANGGWDEARMRKGSRLAWEAARGSVALAAKARGWAHETDEDLLRAICEMDGIDERGDFRGKLRYYSLYRAAEIFRDRARAKEDDVFHVLLVEYWQFANGLRMAQELIAALSNDGMGEGAA